MLWKHVYTSSRSAFRGKICVESSYFSFFFQEIFLCISLWWIDSILCVSVEKPYDGVYYTAIVRRQLSCLGVEYVLRVSKEEQIQVCWLFNLSSEKKMISIFRRGKDATIWCIFGSLTRQHPQLQRASCSLRMQSMCIMIWRIGTCDECYESKDSMVQGQTQWKDRLYNSL